MGFIDRLIDMHYARDGERELFFPCMRITRGFVVNATQKASINRILTPVYYLQLLALLVWLIAGKLGYMSTTMMWSTIVAIVFLYCLATFTLAKIYVGTSDTTAKAENRLFEPKLDDLASSYEKTWLFRGGRFIGVPLLAFALFAYVSAVASWAEVDYVGVLIMVTAIIFLIVPPSQIVKWRRRIYDYRR